MKAKNSFLAFLVAVVVIALCLRLFVGLWASPFKPIADSSLYLLTKSPELRYTVRAYYTNADYPGDSAKSLWCEFYGRSGSPKVFYVEHNAVDNAVIRWILPNTIEINGLVYELPGVRYFLNRHGTQ